MFWNGQKSEWQTVAGGKGKRRPVAARSFVAPPFPAERMGLCASTLRDSLCKLLQRRVKCTKLQKWWRSCVLQAGLHEILCTMLFDTQQEFPAHIQQQCRAPPPHIPQVLPSEKATPVADDAAQALQADVEELGLQQVQPTHPHRIQQHVPCGSPQPPPYGSCVSSYRPSAR